MSLREQLEAIRQRHGQLTPELVLEEARSTEHPLHSRFEWDDSVAAEKYRREQAHELIQSVRLTYAKSNGRPNQIRYYHAVRRPEGHAYEPAAEIVQDEIATKILLSEMERDWRTLKKRYESFREFWALVRSESEDEVA